MTRDVPWVGLPRRAHGLYCLLLLVRAAKAPSGLGSARLTQYPDQHRPQGPRSRSGVRRKCGLSVHSRTLAHHRVLQPDPSTRPRGGRGESGIYTITPSGSVSSGSPTGRITVLAGPRTDPRSCSNGSKREASRATSTLMHRPRPPTHATTLGGDAQMNRRHRPVPS
jgi:hypothetical protein